MVEQGQGELLEVVLALDARRRGPDLLHGGQEQADQDRDDGDDDQQLDQREPAAGDGGWADPDLEIALDGSDTLPTGSGQGQGPCVMNCTNDNEVYSFHTDGANFAFADGSVRFIRDSIRATTFAALTTKAAGDIPDPGDY